MDHRVVLISEKEEMYPPLRFLATYECEECDHQLELLNVYIKKINLWCEECETTTPFKVKTVEHRSMEWDEIVSDL